MKRFVFSLPLLAALGLLSGCNSVDPVDTTLVTGSTDVAATVTAYCDDNTAVKSHTLDYGSARHPFALSIPQGSRCRFTLTTHPDEPRQRATALLLFELDQAAGPRISTKSPSIELGFILLANTELALTGSETDRSEPKPIRVHLADGEALLIDDGTASHDTPPDTQPIL